MQAVSIVVALLHGCFPTDAYHAAKLAEAANNEVAATGDCALSSSFGVEMLPINGGTFTMGGGVADTSDGDDDYADHPVTLTQGFCIGRTEVTRGQWEAAMGTWSFYDDGCDADDCPAQRLSWHDAAQFANAASDSEGLELCYLPDGSNLAASWAGNPYTCPGYRLPTEAEWEYAAHAGEDTVYSGSNNADDVAWTSSNSGDRAWPVCALAENAWGACDMSGNVWEWTNDWYDPDYYDASPSIDPPGPATGSNRVFRGGDWGRDEAYASVAFRYYYVFPAYTADSYSHVGFRLSRSSPVP